MCDTFEFKQYSIVSSLNERNIYIKLTDNVNFINYEGNVDAKELRLQFELPDIYNLIKNCFEQKPDFVVSFNVSSGNIKLLFNAKVGGFLKVNFEALLREKVLSNDDRLTLNINKTEQKYLSLLKRIEELEKINNKRHEEVENIIKKHQEENNRILEAICNTYINIGLDNVKSPNFKLNSKILELNSRQNLDYTKINAFYNLEKLTIIPSNFYDNFINIKNSNLIELICDMQGQPHLQSLKGIENFPKLTKLTVINASGLKDIVTVLSNTNHNIKELKFQSCPQINVLELSTYCQNKGIQLAIC